MDDNIAICGGVAYFAEHFAHKKYNSIWKMPSVLLTESLTLELEGNAMPPDKLLIKTNQEH